MNNFRDVCVALKTQPYLHDRIIFVSFVLENHSVLARAKRNFHLEPKLENSQVIHCVTTVLKFIRVKRAGNFLINTSARLPGQPLLEIIMHWNRQMKRSASESKPFQILPNVEIPSWARREERLACVSQKTRNRNEPEKPFVKLRPLILQSWSFRMLWRE